MGATGLGANTQKKPTKTSTDKFGPHKNTYGNGNGGSGRA